MATDPALRRDALAARGKELVLQFCELNNMPAPRFFATVRGSCGLYSGGTISVQADKCAHPGYGGPAWSWPGYVTDRTPYGVYAHELGHYVDHFFGGWRWGRQVRKETGELRLTSYCPNDAEWFAEMFRLFCTNPSLLAAVRPATHAALTGRGLVPVESRDWHSVIAGCPARTLARAETLAAQAATRQQRVF
jgi:hypothetical protein